MAFGSADCGLAPPAVGGSPKRSAFAPAWTNACLAMLAALSAAVASEPARYPPPVILTGTEAAPSPYAPGKIEPYPPRPRSPDNVNKPISPAPAPTANKPGQAAPPSSVLLPPIQSPPEDDTDAPPSPVAPLVKPSKRRGEEPPRPHLDPPAPVAVPDKHGSMDPKLEGTVRGNTVAVAIGQSRVLVFPDVPRRIVLAVEETDPVATLKAAPGDGREWNLTGRKLGTAFLEVWLPGATKASGDEELHYIIRVLPNPEDQGHLEGMYQTLEREINRTFPGCAVHLSLASEKLVVSGHARSIFEATRILNIARANAPGVRSSGPPSDASAAGAASLQATLDNYGEAGGPHVINLLRIPSEQQIMLRVVVTEVNRAAARSLGLDFGIGDKRATVFTNRPSASGNASTLVDNGCIAEAIKTLQDLHYAHPLAEPTLTTLNGQLARFQAGGEFPVPVAVPSSGGAIQGVSFRPYGVKLSIQPVLAGTERIRMTVTADVTDTDQAAAAVVAGTDVPGLQIRNFQSTVELREGETLAVAGLICGPVGGSSSRAGRFGFGDHPQGDKELVVLISPLLVRPPESDRQVAGPTANPFNPRDIQRYLNRRSKNVAREDAMYLIGPQGYAGDGRHAAAPKR